GALTANVTLPASHAPCKRSSKCMKNARCIRLSLPFTLLRTRPRPCRRSPPVAASARFSCALKHALFHHRDTEGTETHGGASLAKLRFLRASPCTPCLRGEAESCFVIDGYARSICA